MALGYKITSQFPAEYLWGFRKKISIPLSENTWDHLLLESGQNFYDKAEDSVVRKMFFLVFLPTPCGMWDLSSQTRDRTLATCSGAQNPDHWTTREFPRKMILTIEEQVHKDSPPIEMT